MTSYDTLLVEREESIVTIKINRPDKLNALSAVVLRELEGLVAELSADQAVRAVILTGEGEKAFVAGADIKELAKLAPQEAIAKARLGQRVMNAIEQSSRPFIAAINGYALGGGLELALSCDIRFAADSAKLGLPEVTLGLIPGYGGTQRLPRMVGRGKALEMILSGAAIDAAEAHRIGLVDRVVPADKLMAEVTALAKTIVTKAGPVAVSLAKRAVHVGIEQSLETGLAFEASQFGVAYTTQDSAEGLSAFLDKRKPTFRGV
jgi:enoyl-CoA hydratase